MRPMLIAVVLLSFTVTFATADVYKLPPDQVDDAVSALPDDVEAQIRVILNNCPLEDSDPAYGLRGECTFYLDTDTRELWQETNGLKNLQKTETLLTPLKKIPPDTLVLS